MLAKKNRIEKKLLEKVFKDGETVFFGNLTLKYIAGIGQKLSFIASKNVSKRAVDRNLLRRRGYYVLRKHWLEVPPGLTGVFIFGKKSLDFFGGKKRKGKDPVLNLENDLKKILTKIN